MHCQHRTAVHRHCDLPALRVNQRLHLVTGNSYIMTITIIRRWKSLFKVWRHKSETEVWLHWFLTSALDRLTVGFTLRPLTPGEGTHWLRRPDCTYTQINNTCWLQSLSIVTLTCGNRITLSVSWYSVVKLQVTRSHQIWKNKLCLLRHYSWRNA